MSDPPVLEARGLRATYDGAVALDEVEVSTRGARVLLVGDVMPAVRLLSGTSGPGGARAEVAAGELRIGGRVLGQHHGHFGAAPDDLPFPPRTKLRAFLRVVAQVATGEGRRGAAALADATIERLELQELASKRLDRMDLTARKAVLVAVAAVQGDEALLLHEPFTGLPPAGVSTIMGVVGKAVEGKAALVAVADLRLEEASAALLPHATDVLVFRGGRLLLHSDGARLLAESRVYSLTVVDAGEDFAEALRGEGAALTGGPWHYALTLPEGRDVADVLRLADSTGAVVLTCEPLLGAMPAAP